MKQIWDAEELTEYWTLSLKELELLKTKPARNHLGFCLQLKFYQYAGTFPKRRSDFSDTPLHYLADQLQVDVDDILEYEWLGRTGKRHRKEILTLLGISKITAADKDNLSKYLCETVFPKGIELSNVAEYAHEWLKNHNIELPAKKQLARLLSSCYSNFEELIFSKLALSILPKTIKSMDSCLDFPLEEAANFNTLKADPGRLGLESVLGEVDKLKFIQSLALPIEQLELIHPKILARYKQRVISESAWEVKRHPDQIRCALLSIFFYERRSEIIDSLVELFIQVVHKFSARAEKKVYKKLMNDFQKVIGKSSILMKIAEASLEHPEEKVKDVIFPVAGEATLKNLVKEYKSTGNNYKRAVHKVIRSSYSCHYRRMLPHLLDCLDFRSNNKNFRPILTALQWINEHKDSKKQFYLLSDNIPIEGVIRPKWREVVIDIDEKGIERINRINYEICVLQSLREKLRCKEVWVYGARRYRNPDEDLPQDFDEKRDFYYEELGKTTDAVTFVENLKQQMNSSLNSLNESIPSNDKVRILNKGKNRISISPLTAQAEPMNINKIKSELLSRWPMTNLLDILKETDLRIGFTDCFETQRTAARLDQKTLQKRLLLSLYGLGTNTGLKRISGSRHGVSYKELLHVRKFYMHKTALRSAISRVANAIFQARNPRIWGEGTTACASDSKKFGSWDQNLMTEWHLRYGGRV